VRDALRVSVASVAWTVVASTVAVGIAIASSSLVLLAFGLTGAVDAGGSWALAIHFRHALHHDRIDPQRERRAHVIICVGLMVVGGAAAVEAVHRLIAGHEASGSTAGAVLAGASVAVLGVLALVKHRIAGRIASNALRADGNLSATGALLGVITVVGAAASSVSWLDSACALIVGAVAAISGARSLSGGA
jgi:divalent metal cation (Fe/Co/Zn/Cd) transporter